MRYVHHLTFKAVFGFTGLMAIGCGVFAAPVHAQERVQAVAARTASPPTIDGLPDEEVWKDVEPITQFTQSQPQEGQPASERTEVRVLYDDRAIYFGVICFDSNPSLILATDNRRDSGLDESDSFRIIVDTYHDLQNGFLFGTNPAGVEYDAHVTNGGEGGGGGRPGLNSRMDIGTGGSHNLNWDASWTVRTAVTDRGWSAEFAIPLRSLRYGATTPQVWGLNFQRSIRRKLEDVFWAPVDRVHNISRLSRAGELRGLSLATPRNFKVTPYAISSATRAYNRQTEASYDGDFGLDAKLGVTPSLNLDLSYNTDFAQVEVDEQQINLTRFNVFFPEKRPFFLENAGIFTVGDPGRVELFFSRQIGISESGALVPIIGGARLTGKASGLNVGLLSMQADRVTGVTSGNNFTAARVSHELANRSSIGALFVNRLGTGSTAGADNWNRTWAVDGKLGVGKYLALDAFAARTETPHASGREHAFKAGSNYRSLDWEMRLEYNEVGDGFNPEVGYLERKGYRNAEAGLFRMFHHQKDWLREWRPHVVYYSYWNFAGFKETEQLHMDNGFEFENGYVLSTGINRNVEGLEAPFEIYPGVTVRPGSYATYETLIRTNTDRRRALSVAFDLQGGGFLSGTQNSVSPTITFRKGSNFSTSLRWTRRAIDLAEGDFVTNLGSLRVGYNVSRFIYLQSLIQYNDRTERWATNLRFSWLNTAGTGLFFVFNETEGFHGIGPIERAFIVKYTRQFDVLR